MSLLIMKGGMSRVDITGQVNVDNPACSNSSPCKIDQHPSSLVQTPTNWNGFCNAVDEVLTPLTTIKRVAKLSSLLLYIVLAIFVLGVQLLPRTMPNFDYSLLKYSSVVFIPIIVAYAVIYCFYIRRGLSVTMDKVRDVCERYSCDGVVQYSLKAEHWGGCNKVSSYTAFCLIFCIWENQLYH